MNLQHAFFEALNYDDYILKLDNNLSLHQLHYKKCIIEQQYIDTIISCKPSNILVITEPWCGDSLALLPVVKKISEINGQFNVKIHLRDQNLDLIDQFLTNGSRAIPIFLFLDEKFNLRFRWGPRPAEAARIYNDYRQLIEEGKIDKQEVFKKIRTFYAKDSGKSTLSELSGLIGQYLMD